MQIAILLLASGQFALRAKTSPDNPEQQIRELEEKVNGAYAANNLPAYFSCNASDFSQWLPEGRTDLPTYQKGWTRFIQGEAGWNPSPSLIYSSKLAPAGTLPLPVTSFTCVYVTPKVNIRWRQLGVRRFLQARRRLEDYLPALFASSEKESSVVRGLWTPRPSFLPALR